MQLENKVVLLTGGAAGIGKGLCKGLLAKGAKVCFCDWNKEEGLDTLSELRAEYGEENVMFVECDISDHDCFDDLFKETKDKFGGIDVLINNAAILSEGQDWRRSIAVNLIGTIDGSKLADTYMSFQNGDKGGVVMNMASIRGFIPHLRVPVYCASKFGVVGVTRSLALRAQEKQTGLRYVCLCPDRVAAGHGNRAGTPEELAKMGFEDLTPMTRDPSDIVSLETVVDAVIELIETEDNNGGVMSITQKEGCQYVHGEPESSRK